MFSDFFRNSIRKPVDVCYKLRVPNVDPFFQLWLIGFFNGITLSDFLYHAFSVYHEHAH